ncbi:murein DD-endopeptidase MepM/ murein hydrolase activator NlpD [Pseudomonas sp. BIGb0408]|uniref:Murein DD-endopeptidase MepM/ murein hydrolase activator NlpD n=1 Tax=Phytopseudomonas flavescens TaxID=29435 RepID=A0A7Y9XSE1_9GAMM|nr:MULTISPECIES: M23 family metallopeptidase [Pseudomonas]MCW2294103.1 murein DD-endopeptidase MepM/ murein hydrolase activator NlpD [Pseudomonas sp. BIGb0408]NYH76623.1 murein DD-endopeptidase MepM/ murein hydrolase activator NlpD [Pseudomonas flavescens]
MHIILLSRRHGAARSLSLDLRWLAIGLALLVALAVGGGAAVGAWLAPKPTGLPESVEITQALDAQRDEVGAVRIDAQRQLDAFAAHVAELQARLTRLDALGERLTELAELDASEFDFSLGVGQGGPEEPIGSAAYAPPPFMSSLDELAMRMDSREQQLEVLEQLLADRRIDEAVMLSGHPVLQGYVSSPFGHRVDPLTGRASVHKGVDFAAKAGSDVVAVGAGVVTFAGRRNGYGNTVEISHADGYVTLYAHNRSNRVQVGDLVQRGQAIATVGSTGRSTGNHVHFEVSRNGQLVNPHSYIARVSDEE